MTNEQRLVYQIRTFLRSYERERTPVAEDFAERLADLSHALNERLLKCQEYLDKGRRSEAVHEAQVPPPLLEQVEILNFAERAEWRQFCADNGMKVSDELQTDIVERLRAECGTEELLAPLLNEYRRLVHQGGRDQRISVLRQIRDYDRDNRVWAENLAPLESDALEELLREADKAMKAGNLQRLQEIRDELLDPRRVVPPPPDALLKIEGVLRARREEQAAEEGAKTAELLRTTLDAEDWPALRAALRKWQRLKSYEDFHPTSAMLAVAEEAAARSEREERRRREDDDFNQALRQVRDELEAPQTNPETLEQAWRRLKNFSRPLPAALEDSVLDFQKRLRAAATRRRAAIIGLVFLVLAVLAVFGAVWFKRDQDQRTRARLLANLAGLMEQERLEAARELIEEIRVNRPDVYQLPEVRQAQDKVETTLSSAAARLAEFTAVAAQLRDIRAANYVEPTLRINKLLERGSALAQGAEETGFIESWQKGWKTFLAGRQERRDREFSVALQTIRSGLDERRRLSSGPAEIERNRIVELRRQLGVLEANTDGVTPALLAGIGEVRKALRTWEDELDERLRGAAAAAARQEQILRTFDRALPDLNAYRKLLEEFVRDFGGAPEATQFRRALAEMDTYRDVLALNSFRLEAMPPAAGALAGLEKLAKELPGGPESVWLPDLRRAIEAGTRAAAAKPELLKLREVPGYNLKQIQIRPVTGGDWQTLYYPEEIFSREEKLEDGTSVTTFWGKVYRDCPDEMAPLLEHMRHNSKEYELRMNRREESNIVPHGRWVRALLGEADKSPEAADLGVFVLNRAAALAAEGECAIIPKAALLSRLLRLAAGLLEEVRAELNAAAATLDMPADVLQSWVNGGHPVVAEARTRLMVAIQGLPKFQPLLERVRQNRALLQAAMSRQLRCVGCVRPGAAGILEPALTLGGADTVWIVSLARDGGRRVFTEALRRQADGKYETVRGAQEQFFLGQLLFAPKDGRTAETVLTDLKMPRDAKPYWPHSWPVNARSR